METANAVPTIETITATLFEVIDELNRMLPAGEHLSRDVRTALMGDSGRLDSAGLINLIVIAEQRLGERLGKPVLLTDDRTLSRVGEVFGTIGSLAHHVQGLLSESADVG